MSKTPDEGSVPEVVPGFSRAGDFAVANGTRAAMAGSYGLANLKGPGGIAIVGDNGVAMGGEQTVAVSRGRDCLFGIGRGGIVFSPHEALELSVGDAGLLIATKPVSNVIAGKDAIVVLTGADTTGPLIQAGANSLVIRRSMTGPTPAGGAALIAMPGQAGLQEAEIGLMLCDAVIYCKSNLERCEPYITGKQKEIEAWHSRFDERIISQQEIELRATASPKPQPETIATRDWIDPVSHPRKLILCERFPRDARFAAGSIISTKWDSSATVKDGIVGLLWGIGDPAASGLGYGEDWALVAVPSYEAVGPLDDRGHPSVVIFRAGLIVEDGSNGDILRRLIELGVEPGRLIGEVKSTGDGGHVEVGAHGAARAGDGGWATAGRNGQAEVGENGFAEAGAYGFAKAGTHGIAACEADGIAVAGPGGVAISYGKRYGTATVGFEGLAVGDGRFKTVSAGPGGAAVSTSYGGRVTAGDEGIAVGYGDITAGRSGVAIALEGTVAGGDGCLLVGCIHSVDGTRRFVSAIAGREGYLPDVRYSVQDGALRPYVEAVSK